MRPSLFALGVLGLAGLFAGCGGSGSSLQPAVVQQGAPGSHAPGRSWILPDAKNNDLLYISDLLAQVVDIYTYKSGHKLVGQLTGFFNPEGLCVDKAGNVYVTNDTSLGVYQITEYAHGSTVPIQTINDPDGRANGCSVDPTTGNLAVADFWGPTERIGNVAVWPHGGGSPTSYSIPNIYYYYYCAYDNQGNLFVDGETTGSVFGLGELPKGGSSLNFINVSQTIYLPGGVQWDGKYLAVGDQVAVKHSFTSTIYQFSISGSVATEVGTMVLNGSKQVAQFWLPRVEGGPKHPDATHVIAPNQNGADTLIYDYPSGTSPIQTIPGETDPLGATVSRARKSL
jgi:WD40 repeat protein